MLKAATLAVALAQSATFTGRVVDFFLDYLPLLTDENVSQSGWDMTKYFLYFASHAALVVFFWVLFMRQVRKQRGGRAMAASTG